MDERLSRPSQQTAPTTDSDRDDRLPLLRRKVFDQDLVAFATVAKQASEPVALLMIDLDRFKAVNDTHGHPIGDEVLLGVAEIIAKGVRGKGKAYRYGGEEMTVILPNYSVDEATVLAERLRRDIEGATVSTQGLKVTVSIGVASFPDHASEPKTLLDKADKAMYEAKNFGRNLVRISGEPRPMNPGRSRSRKK